MVILMPTTDEGMSVGGSLSSLPEGVTSAKASSPAAGEPTGQQFVLNGQGSEIESAVGSAPNQPLQPTYESTTLIASSVPAPSVAAVVASLITPNDTARIRLFAAASEDMVRWRIKALIHHSTWVVD